MGEWSNEEWIQALNGTPEQREEAFGRLWEFLYRSALKMTSGDKFLADDCAQEAIICVLKNLDGFHWKSKLETWAYSILRNVYRDMFRGRKADEMAIDPGRGNGPGGEESSDREERRAQFRADLRACLARLSDSQRRAFVKRYIVDLTINEIRACLETTSAYVFKLLSQARRSLRACLEEAGWGVHSFV
jgi:RNA polymerase sigma-70 factor (ECF subfamily)